MRSRPKKHRHKTTGRPPRRRIAERQAMSDLLIDFADAANELNLRRSALALGEPRFRAAAAPPPPPPPPPPPQDLVAEAFQGYPVSCLSFTPGLMTGIARIEVLDLGELLDFAATHSVREAADLMRVAPAEAFELIVTMEALRRAFLSGRPSLLGERGGVDRG